MSKIIGTGSDAATIFQSSKAVGLIIGTTEEHCGGFFSPMQAREIAAALVEFANAADQEPTMTREEASAVVASWSDGDQRIGFQFVEQGIYAEVAMDRFRPARKPMQGGRRLLIHGENPELANCEVMLFDNLGLFLAARKINDKGVIQWS